MMPAPRTEAGQRRTVVAMSWTLSQMPDLTGRRALVTGANSGIGFPTALELARAGAAVTLACRKPDQGAAAVDRIRAQLPQASVDFLPLDLASLTSVEQLAQRWEGPLHLLINNAGVMAPPTYQQTADGFELQFGTNHLGHFALTGRLLPHLLEAGDARVVTVASIAHRGGERDVLFGNQGGTYNAQHAYSNSKLANLLFGQELQRRAQGKLTSTMAHPGVSSTNLVASRDGMGANAIVRLVGPLVVKVLFQPAAAGALPSLYAAVAAEPGSYSGPQGLREVRGKPGPAALSPVASDAGLAAQLWELSEEWTGVHYAF
jgi:NAD(P)-dependent dehydrogenase (short-subunit alcohol dehydrogenase family)